MVKNKIVDEILSSFSEDDMRFAEETLFGDSTEEILPKKENSGKKTKPKTNKINPTNYVDIGEHMIYSTYEFSLLTQKLFYTAISEIQAGEKEFNEIVLKDTDIVNNLGISSKNVYSELFRVSEELANLYVIAYSERTYSLERIMVFDKKRVPRKEGVIYLKFSESMKEYLLHLQNKFYKVPLAFLLQLPTQNAMKLFHALYGWQYYKKNENKRHNKINKDGYFDLIVPYDKLKSMFEFEMYDEYIKKGVWGKEKYPTTKSFVRNVLDKSIEAINKGEILYVEMIKIKGEKQNLDEKFYPNAASKENSRKTSHIIFRIKDGSKYEEFEQDRNNKKNPRDELLEEICEYFKVRFDINQIALKKLVKEYGYTYQELMLSAISMQSVLNFSSRGLWIYTEDKPNWRDLNYRIATYIKEYMQISLPNLGAFYDDKKIFHQLIIKEPFGFLKSTLKDRWYLSTIDLINKQGTLTAFASTTNERLCVSALYDNQEWGEKLKTCLKRYNSPKNANEEGKEFDLIYKIFSFFCRDSALKLNPNSNWKNYFYSGLNELDVYWKVNKYEQHPDKQQSIRKTVDRILAERNLL